MNIKLASSISVAVLLTVLSAGAARAESLLAALASAYANNPQIASALLSVKASAEDIAYRKAGKLPSIGANASYSYGWSVASGGSGYSSADNFTLNLSYKQRLFDNLKTDAEIEQARAYSEVAEQNLRNAVQNVLLSAANAYVGVVRDTKLAQLRQNSVSFYQAQVSSAEDRLKIGEGTKTDVSQAEASLAQAVASYKTAVSSLQTSQASYMRWIGHKPKSLSLDLNVDRYLPKTLDGALASADANHPAIRSAMAQVRAAQSASDAAKAAFGPTLDLIGSICAVECFGAGSSGMSGSVRLTLSIPIYSGGALGATVRQANINQIKSEVDAQSARDQVRESVIQSWSGLQNASAQISATNTAVSASQQVLSGVIEERNVGQRTTLDVLNAQSNLTSVQESNVQAQTSRVSAAFALLAAAGKLDTTTLNLAVEVQSADGYRAKVEDIWKDLRAVPN